MDILSNFETYLNEWCTKKKLPNPGMNNINKVWKLAWTDYTKEVLVGKWEDYKEQYLNMQLKTSDIKSNISRESVQGDVVDSCRKEDEPKQTEWEKVRELLK